MLTTVDMVLLIPLSVIFLALETARRIVVVIAETWFTPWLRLMASILALMVACVDLEATHLLKVIRHQFPQGAILHRIPHRTHLPINLRTCHRTSPPAPMVLRLRAVGMASLALAFCIQS
jgi:hypothetical protein